MSRGRAARTIPKPALPYLKRMLAHTNDLPLMCMFWAINTLQTDEPGPAKKFLNYPKEAVTPEIGSKYAVYKWDLETLVTLTLNTPKANLLGFLMKPVDTREFNTVAELVNSLRAVEEDDTEDRLNNENILLEMHRVSHRQFAWQRGWAREVDIYRYLYIYGQGLCAEYFEKTYGLTIPQFFGVSFALYATLVNGPWTPRLETGLELIDIDNDAVTKAYAMLSAEIWATRRESLALLNKFEASLKITLPVVYQPSYLRVKPLIRSAVLGNKYIAPLPSLLMLRATLGLYYDLAPGGTKVMNDATARFEEYARRSIKALCAEFDPAPAVQYVYNKNNIDTPDILLKRHGRVVAVFECKATKLTFEAQYGEDPIENAKSGYEQITKAVYQLWKFFSHVRRGIIKMDVADDAAAIVLTMEAWTQMAGPLRKRITDEANAMAMAKDPDITEEDKRLSIFCPIQDLDELLMVSTEDELLQTFRAATEEKYAGWGTRSIRSRIADEPEKRKALPFKLSEVLPWWEKVEEAKAARDEKKQD